MSQPDDNFKDLDQTPEELQANTTAYEHYRGKKDRQLKEEISKKIDEEAMPEAVDRMQEMANHVSDVHKQIHEESSTQQEVKYEPHYRCNFCSKGAERVFLLVQGPGVNICNECIMEGMELIQKEVVRRETKLDKVVKFKSEDE